MIDVALKAFDLLAERIMPGIQEPDVKAEPIGNTEAAVQRGAFGLPNCFVGGELFSGRTVFQQEQAARRGRGDRTAERLEEPCVDPPDWPKR